MTNKEANRIIDGYVSFKEAKVLRINTQCRCTRLNKEFNARTLNEIKKHLFDDLKKDSKHGI